MRACVVLICLVVFIQVSFAQNAQPVPTGPLTLRQQYANLKSDLEVINGFRMVKLYEMDQFWRVIEDSLKTKRSAIQEGLVTINRQTAEINTLKGQLAQTQTEKQELVSGVENIDVFGMSFSKAGFVTFATSVVVALIVVSIILFVIGRIAYQSSRELKKVNEDVYKEFEDYKHQAVEKNIKLSRELQNMRNRMAELKIA